jgi:predicted alpha/beta superfamily hydrolase
MKKFTTILVLFLVFNIAQAQDFSGVSTLHKIESKIFNDEREIRVYVPYSYKEAKNEYPVIYLFDGQYDPLFDITTGISNYMAQSGLSSEFIVVGIKTKNRPQEFTPKYNNEKTAEDWGEETDIGKAKLLEGYLKNEVFPLVENNYRVKSLRLAIGHSLGGTFVLNSILSQPDFFKGIIAISPNVSYDYEQLVGRYDAFLKTNKSLDKFIYVSAGTLGNMENKFRKSMNKLDKVIAYHNPKGLIYDFQTLENFGHSYTPIRTIESGLTSFAKIWNITEDKIETFLGTNDVSFVDNLKAFYSEVSVWGGYDVFPTSNEINGYGYEAIYANKLNQALLVFNWALELHPNDSNLYDSKAETLEKMKNYKDALVYYEKALSKLKENKADYDVENYEFYEAAYKENINRVKK